MTNILLVCYVHLVVKSSQPLDEVGPLIIPILWKEDRLRGMKWFPQGCSAGFPLFLVMVGASNIHFLPFPLRSIRNTLSQLPDYFSFWLLVNAMTWMLVSLPGKAHPTGWDYAAVICQTRACSVHLRSGSWDGGDRNHGEDGEFLVGTSGTWRALVPKIWTPLLVILWLHTSQFEGAGGTRWTVPSWSISLLFISSDLAVLQVNARHCGSAAQRHLPITAMSLTPS